MIEFTYNGMVRYGFGFHNPNHAAALFCAISPFLWAAWGRWKHWNVRIPVLVLSFSLVFAIALTFSRTGALVLIFELLGFSFFSKYKNWKFAVSIFVSFLLIFIVGNALSRFNIDRSVTNRFDIWGAGMSLFAANPLSGVGLGNSGKLASTFLLPDGTACRTLVNSHLTLLVEFGVFAGLLWGTLVVYSLFSGIKKVTAWTSFAGLCISAFSASLFDWDVLFDFSQYGSLSLPNFLLSWSVLALFISLAVYLCFGKIRWNRFVFSLVIVALLYGNIFIFCSGEAPEVRGEFIVRQGNSMPLILYDNNWTLKTVRPFLHDGYYLPVKSCQMRKELPLVKTDTVYLFGECAAFASVFPDARLIFISPSEFFELPANTEKIYLKRFLETRNETVKTEYY